MNPRMNIHLIGIGGIGMSGLARMYLAMGHGVQGSDVMKTELLADLEREGARIFLGHDATHVNNAHWVVYSSSIPANHPERLAALECHARLLHRAEALAEICEGKDTIAVTGTHGKTTTTALIGTVLREAGRDPSIVVGGLVNSFGGNAYYGTGQEIVIEADESDSSFLKFSPKIEVITNIEEEHMDHFKTLTDVEDAYRRFVGRLSPDGVCFGCAEDERVLKIAAENIRKGWLYGFDRSKSRVYATDILECPGGTRGISFKAWDQERCLGEVQMRLVGRHNVLNALAAVSIGIYLGVPFSVVAKALHAYEGTVRRFDVKYEDSDYQVVDDYAHHPTEIKKTLTAAQALKPKRIVAIFQPHRFTRTERLLKEFGASFAAADKLVVTDIYAADEAPIAGVNGEQLCFEVIKSGHRDAAYVARQEILRYVQGQILPGDLVITLGAGDIYQSAYELSEFLGKNSTSRAIKNGYGNIFGGIRGRVIPDELLSRHTSLKVGGPVDFWIEPEDLEDLRKTLGVCRAHSVPMHVFGAGTNVLPPDEGVSGAAIHLASGYFLRMSLEKGHVTARAGVQNTRFIQYAFTHGFGGFEFLLGVPGNIGGAIAMNAGSHKQSIDALLVSVTTVGLDGKLRMLAARDIPFTYRSSGIQKAVIVEAAFLLPPGDRAGVQKKLDEYRDYRMSTQDLRHPSAGCMFKNPESSECSSGQLIEDCGLKGRRVGNAQVSTRHANFIINLGGAKARDLLSLIEEVRETVKRRFNVELEMEVKIL